GGGVGFAAGVAAPLRVGPEQPPLRLGLEAGGAGMAVAGHHPTPPSVDHGWCWSEASSSKFRIHAPWSPTGRTSIDRDAFHDRFRSARAANGASTTWCSASHVTVWPSVDSDVAVDLPSTPTCWASHA